ncbi:MAG: pseudouridine synthase [Phycisphaerales bacterium]|nr:pseudouridine synthase [Phycisphaerales bacterium]
MSSDEARTDLPEVLLEQAGTLVIQKPHGVSTQMRVDEQGVSIIERIRRNGYPKAEVPHRLDRMTGGILIVATDHDSLRFHNESIRDGLWTKIYVARTRRPTHAFKILGRKKLYLRRKGRSAQVVQSGGKTARMELLAIADVPGQHELMDVVIDLETGRFHQIRAMMKHYKAPIAGDTTYGDETPVTPLLTHAMMRLPLPDGTWHLIRADLESEGAEFDQELHDFMDQLEAQLAPRKK